MGRLFKPAPVLTWPLHVGITCLLSFWLILYISWASPAGIVSPRSSVPFMGESYIEPKIWVPGVLIAEGCIASQPSHSSFRFIAPYSACEKGKIVSIPSTEALCLTPCIESQSSILLITSLPHFCGFVFVFSFTYQGHRVEETRGWEKPQMFKSVEHNCPVRI